LLYFKNEHLRLLAATAQAHPREEALLEYLHGQEGEPSDGNYGLALLRDEEHQLQALVFFYRQNSTIVVEAAYVRRPPGDRSSSEKRLHRIFCQYMARSAWFMLGTLGYPSFARSNMDRVLDLNRGKMQGKGIGGSPSELVNRGFKEYTAKFEELYYKLRPALSPQFSTCSLPVISSSNSASLEACLSSIDEYLLPGHDVSQNGPYPKLPGHTTTLFVRLAVNLKTNNAWDPETEFASKTYRALITVLWPPLCAASRPTPTSLCVLCSSNLQ
jgi:hypothetical protein